MKKRMERQELEDFHFSKRSIRDAFVIKLIAFSKNLPYTFNNKNLR
jgi:hypothetical protein